MKARRRVIGTALGLAIGSVVGTARGAQPAATCRSGTTDFHSAGVRVFEMTRIYGNPHTEGSHYKAFYACRKGQRKPLMFWGGPFVRDDAGSFELVGNRLGFLATAEGVSSGSETTIGWVQLPLGPVRTKPIYQDEGEAEEPEPGPKIPSEEIHYRLAADGTIALAGEGFDLRAPEHDGSLPTEWEVALLTYTGRRLSPPKALLKTQTPSEAPALSSLNVDATSVSWTNRSGAHVSIPRPGSGQTGRSDPSS